MIPTTIFAMQAYSEKYKSEIKVEYEDSKLSKGMEVFLNQNMYFNRLTNFLIAQKEKPKKAVDLMCASGILSIALQKDLGIKTIANDLNPRALRSVEKNARLNDVKITTTRHSADEYPLKTEDFFIIDPFGSPAKTIEHVIKNCKLNSIICSTATDITVLGGKYPQKSLSMYGSEIKLNGFADEMRVRSLLGFCERIAKENNKSIIPLFCYTENHYAKISIKVVEKNTKRNLGFAYYDPKTGEGFISIKKIPKTELLESGAIWISNIKNEKLKGVKEFNFFPIKNKHYINIKKFYQYRKLQLPKKVAMLKYGKFSDFNYTLFMSKEKLEKIKN